MITVRPIITLPGAGEFALVNLAGQVIYVEASPSNDPAVAPTLHLSRNEDGIPIYDRLSIKFDRQSDRFWIRNNDASLEGEIVRLFISEDPCADFDTLNLTSCGPSAGAADFEPTGTPTHVLQVGFSDIRVIDSAGSLVRTVLAFGTYDRIGKAWVDYGTERIWFFGRRDVAGSDHCILTVVNFDGTGLTELWDSGQPATTEDTGIDWDEGNGFFVVCAGSSVYSVNRDGSNPILVSNAAITRRDVAGAHNGAYVSGHSTSINVRSYASDTTLFSAGISGRAVHCDPLTGKIYRISGGTTGLLERMDGDLTNAESIDSNIDVDGRLYRYGRWLYYTTSNGEFKRVHLDDITMIESIATGQATISANVPWWE